MTGVEASLKTARRSVSNISMPFSLTQPVHDWLASLGNPNTRRVYNRAIKDFMQFGASMGVGEIRTITRVHVIVWREYLLRQGLGRGTVRHRLAALSSLFEFLCEANIVACNPVADVKRPKRILDASKPGVLDNDCEIQPELEPIWMYIDY
jgi:site-specific recombinase XerC